MPRTSGKIVVTVRSMIGDAGVPGDLSRQQRNFAR